MSKLTFLSGSASDSLALILKEQEPGIDKIIVSRSFITRTKQYTNVLHALSNSGRQIRIMDSCLTLPDINRVIDEVKPETTFLVLGGGRLIDFLKLVCAKTECNLVVSPMFLSNDGFASGCSSIPSGEGSHITCPSKIPQHVYAIHAILKQMPYDFVVSGLGELIAKFNVIEDLKLDHSLTEKQKRLMNRAMNHLFQFFLSGFKNTDFNKPIFLNGLAQSLFHFSILMPTGSELCSRSEHEFEKACMMAGATMHHGILVLCGSFVAMKLRENQRSYRNILKLTQYLGLAEDMKRYFHQLLRHLETTLLKQHLQQLSSLRKDRISLWNHIDSTQIEWEKIFKEIYSDLTYATPAKKSRRELDQNDYAIRRILVQN